jgi:hypothetical protein
VLEGNSAVEVFPSNLTQPLSAVREFPKPYLIAKNYTFNNIITVNLYHNTREQLITESR